MAIPTISTADAENLKQQLTPKASPIKRAIQSLIMSLSQTSKVATQESQEKIHDLLALGDKANAASTSVARYNSLLSKIIERYKQQEVDGHAEKYSEYTQLSLNIEKFIEDLAIANPEIADYIQTYGLSPADYKILSDFEELIQTLNTNKEKLRGLEDEKTRTKTQIDELNSPQWTTIIMRKLIAEEDKKKNEEIYTIQTKATTVVKKKGKFGDAIESLSKGKKSADELKVQELKKYRYNLQAAQTFAIGHSLEEVKKKYEATQSDPELGGVSKFMLDLVSKIEGDVAQKDLTLKELNTNFGSLSTQIVDLTKAIETDKKKAEDSIDAYQEVDAKVEENHEKFLEKVVDLIGEKVSAGDTEIIDLLVQLSDMEASIKLDMQKEGFDGQGVKNDVEGLYTKLTSFANEFIYPKIAKGTKKKDPKYSVKTGKSNRLRKGVSRGTSGVSGIMGGLGLMHMIPGWASNPNEFFLGSKVGAWVQDLYTTTNGDIEKMRVYGTGAITLVAIFAALEKFKRHMDHSVEKVGMENIQTQSTLKSFWKNFTGKGSKLVLAVGISATLMAGWTDMSGVASGLFGGQKRKAEKEKIDQTIKDMTKQYEDVIRYIEVTDSTAGNALQLVLDQENNGGAASGIGGRGPVYSSKALLQSGELSPDLIGVNPNDINEGKRILSQAGGKEAQYDSLHTHLQAAIETLKDAMVVHTTAGKEIDWNNIGKEAERFTGGIDPSQSMQLKDFANQIDQSTQNALALMDSAAGKYNGDLGNLKQVYDNIESIVQSGQKLNISLIDTAAFQKKLKDISIASKKASAAIKQIEPYMSYGNVTDHLRKSGYNQLQMVLVELSIMLLILLLHSIYPVRSLISLKRNKKDQSQELNLDFNDVAAQVDVLTAKIDSMTPAFITTDTVNNIQEIYTNANIGEDVDFQELVAKIMADDQLNRKEQEDKAALASSITSDLIKYTTANLSTLIENNKSAIDAEMEANGMILADADQDPVTYTDFFATLKDHATWSPMQFVAAFVKGSKTFRDAVLEGYNTKNSTGK